MPVIELDRRAGGRAARSHGVAHRTPVLTSRTLDGLAARRCIVKAECFQRGGAFKFRGAYNKIASLPEHARARGVHRVLVRQPRAGGRDRGAACSTCPRRSSCRRTRRRRSSTRRAATARRSSRTTGSTESREEIGARLAEERGLALVKPYDDPLVMAGQGTVALELLEEVPEPRRARDAGRRRRPDRRLRDRREGAAPGDARRRRRAGAGNDTARSLAAGERVNVGVPRTIADGLQATEPGELTFAVNRELVDEIVTVSDAEIVDAMAFLFDRMKLVVEPSGAVGIAALLHGRIAGARSAS